MDLQEVFTFSAERQLEMLARMALAAFVGGIIGFERQHAGRPAGIRTMSLVALGSCLFTLVSVSGFELIGQNRDPARVAAGVVAGVGFIGAGSVIRSGLAVRGLTTASGIWVSASLGMAAATGMYVLAVGGALLSFLILRLLPHGPDEFR